MAIDARSRRCLAAITAVLGAGLVMGWWGGRLAERVTLVSLSPDEQTRVWLVEKPHWIDRNFVVRVEEMKSGDSRIVFRSPDEGRPIGSERIVWASDSERFLVLGRHFYTAPDALLGSGNKLYLLHDLRSGRTWSNASQQVHFSSFSKADLMSTAWQETPGF